MITIYYDFDDIIPSEYGDNVLVVRKVQDYVHLRQYIRRMLDIEGICSIYVKIPILAQWLRDLRDYESDIIKWEEVNIHTHFEQQYGFSPPRGLSDDALKYLLQILPSNKGTEITDPIGWILGRSVNPLWEYTQPDENHFMSLALWAIKKQQVPTSLFPITKVRLTEWSKFDPRYRLFLESSWQDAAEKFFLRWALHSYPACFQLRQELDAVPLVDCSQHKDMCLKLLRPYNQQIKQFWHSWLTSNNADTITPLLQWSSGLANAELEAVEQWAKSHQQDLTIQHVRQIGEHFSYLRNIESVLKRLESFVPPPLPEEPQTVWTIEKWLDWVVDEYMPYFTWNIRNDQSREFQMNLASQFENWLIGIYPKLLQDFNAPFSPHQWGRIKELFDTDKVDVVLWFIVDGLTWWQGERLASLCVASDVGGIYIQPEISVLPTITSIAKKALVQGYLNPSETVQPIAQILKTRSPQNMRQIQVYTQHGELEQRFSYPLSPGLYTLLYNALDHHVHDDRGFTDDESVEGHLRLIARLIKEGFDHCLEQGLRVKAFVNSDHGSTLLPERADVLKIPSFASTLDDDDFIGDTEEPTSDRKTVLQTMRVCATDRIPDSYNLQSLEKNWHYLQKDIFVLPKQFFLPRGYNAVERRPRGWTHGGATPEEVVVPALELQPTKPEIIQPSLHLKGDLFPYKASTLQVALDNFNAFPLKILQLVIGDSTAQIASTIRPIASAIGEVEVPPTNGKEAHRTIEWSLTCEGGGSRESFRGQQDMAVRRLQVSEVDEMFEDML